MTTSPGSRVFSIPATDPYSRNSLLTGASENFSPLFHKISSAVKLSRDRLPVMPDRWAIQNAVDFKLSSVPLNQIHLTGELLAVARGSAGPEVDRQRLPLRRSADLRVGEQFVDDEHRPRPLTATQPVERLLHALERREPRDHARKVDASRHRELGEPRQLGATLPEP